MAISIGDAILFLSADDAKLKKGLKSAETATARSTKIMSQRVEAASKGMSNAMGRMGSRMAAAGGAYLGISALKQYTSQWIQMGDAVEEQSQRTGLSVELLSQLNWVAGRAGLNLENLEIIIRQMAKNLYSTTGATKLFGDSLKDLRKLSPDQQFMRIMEALSNIPDPTLRAARAMQVFGRSGTLILPLVNMGMKKLGESMALAQRNGVVFTTDQAKRAGEYADVLDELAGRFTTLGGVILESGVGSALKQINDIMAGKPPAAPTGDVFGEPNTPSTSGEKPNMWKEAKDKMGNFLNKPQGWQNFSPFGKIWDMQNQWFGTQDNTETFATQQTAKEFEAKKRYYAARQQQANRVASGLESTGIAGEPAGDPSIFRTPEQQRRAQGYIARDGAMAGVGAYSNEESRLSKQGVSDPELASRNANYNNCVINNWTVSNGTFTASDDMKRALNRKKAMSPGI